MKVISALIDSDKSEHCAPSSFFGRMTNGMSSFHSSRLVLL